MQIQKQLKWKKARQVKSCSFVYDHSKIDLNGNTMTNIVGSRGVDS